ncbi:N-acetyltransferase family protein [Roseococcus sp. YIM B11640]|uniref:GNAT family N-acetyltransferase n=1 Tax=Roseococcus sp. YIM B11640 TaxID=3133973 RepID=UPI003C7D6B00
MSSGFTWRETKPADVPDIHRLLHGLAVYEKIEHEFTVTPEQLREALFGSRPLAEAMLADVDGKPVAVCLWYRTFSSFAGKAELWIEDIFVEPEHRKKGIARAAFRLVAQRALEEGCASIGWNVLDWNAPAIAAYRAMGAVGREEWTDQRVSGPALVALAGKG